MLAKVRASSPISSWRSVSMTTLWSRSPVLPILCATVINFESGSVIERDVRNAMPMPTARATITLKNDATIVPVAAFSSEARRSSTIFLFSLSAASRNSVEFLTQDDASFCK